MYKEKACMSWFIHMSFLEMKNYVVVCVLRLRENFNEMLEV